MKSAKTFIREDIKAGVLKYSKDSRAGRTLCEIEIKGTCCTIHEDYALFQPGPDYTESGTRVFCLNTGAEENTMGYYSATNLVLRCVDEKEYIYQRIGMVIAYEKSISRERFGVFREPSIITLI